MELSVEQKRALALAAARRRQKQKLETGQPHDGVPAYVPPGVEGYDAQTGTVTQPRREFGMGSSFATGAADAASFGFADELASYPASVLSGLPREQVLSEMRGNMSGAQEQNPGSYMAGQLAGGVAQGVALSPVSATAQLTTRSTPMIGRIGAGMADGAAFAGLYGAGSGTDAASRASEAAWGAGLGAAVGGVFPVASSLLGAGYRGIQNARQAGPIAREAGASPEALRMLGTVMQADGSLGSRGASNMARAGQSAMLADAGPNARSVLDTAIQRGGPGAIVARDAIDNRATGAARDLTSALNQTLGDPQGITAARTAIRTGSSSARNSAYDAAYSAPIDYSSRLGQEVEGIVRNRVPPAAIKRANDLMRINGEESQQILARVADDGSYTLERLPDVRQLDYITRALNDVANDAQGAGAMGGTSDIGRAYQNLSRDIRGKVKELVPEYATALETAADPIRRAQAIDLGSKILSPSMTRDQVAEAVKGLSAPEQQALASGIRSQIDDAMARVTRTVQDGDTPAREAVKALRDLSSRANREKLSLAVGKQKAEPLFREIDRVAQSFDLRASVADNSKTYARQAVDQRIQDITEPGVIGTAAQGKPLNAMQRIAQSLTGQTPERIRGDQDRVYSELARLLTSNGGAGQKIYQGIDRLGTTDAATELMSSRIAQLLAGPRVAYPSTTQLQDMRSR